MLVINKKTIGMNKLVKFICVVTIVGTFFSCNGDTQKANNSKPIELGWKSVYQNDEEGNRLYGNIDSLIAGIRNGYDVRVGWVGRKS